MRGTEDLRPLSLEKGVQLHAAGSCLVKLGRTHVLCAATNTRSDREAPRGKQQGRTVEIQRLIGRSLRQAVDLAALGERTLTVDCNLVAARAMMGGELDLVELQGTGEGRSFSRAEALGLMDLGLAGCAALMEAQRVALA